MLVYLDVNVQMTENDGKKRRTSIGYNQTHMSISSASWSWMILLQVLVYKNIFQYQILNYIVETALLWPKFALL